MLGHEGFGFNMFELRSHPKAPTVNPKPFSLKPSTLNRARLDRSADVFQHARRAENSPDLLFRSKYLCAYRMGLGFRAFSDVLGRVLGRCVAHVWGPDEVRVIVTPFIRRMHIRDIMQCVLFYTV